jgi:hypothetical protein
MAQQQNRQNALDGYITVAERIEKFYQAFPSGRINTTILDHDRESGFVLMRAEVFRAPDDALPSATGHAFEVRGDSYVNKTSYVENCETSAAGRALALLGFEIRRGIASREEMEKAGRGSTTAGEAQVASKQPPAAEVAAGDEGQAKPNKRAKMISRIGELISEANQLGVKLPQDVFSPATIALSDEELEQRGTRINGMLKDAREKAAA